MSCIKDDLIQKYIDGEATKKEISLIEEHLTGCERCSEKVDHQRNLANRVKKEINLLTAGRIEIPAFISSPGPVKKNLSTDRRLIYIFSAACILLFILFITHKKEPKIDNDIIVTQFYDWDNYNANQTLSQQPLVIHFFDSKGDVNKYFIE